MLRQTLMAAAAVGALAATPAYAAITISAVDGSSSYSGPFTFDFESSAPVSGGLVTNTSVGGVSAQPWGSSGNFWTVGPTDGSPGILDLSSFGAILSISFLWGSIDTYNTLEVLGGDILAPALATFTGANVASGDFGNQTLPATNRLVTLTFSGDDQTAVRNLRLSSTSNAFEVDNFTVIESRLVESGVPEPATWAMMLLGFGLVGFGLRKRNATPGQSRLRVACS